MNRSEQQRPTKKYRNQGHARDRDMHRENVRDRLAQIVIDSPAEADCGNKAFEIVIQKHERRGFACDVGATSAHGYADMGSFERGSIVDAVEKNQAKIVKYSAEIGHYISDSHVPLHACSNHNGQFTDQKGIHGFWESRIPELLAQKEWDFFIGKAGYIKNPADFIWARVLESAVAADTVLKLEKELSIKYPAGQKYAFEDRNGTIIRQYSTSFSIDYNNLLKGMVERRMRQSIYAVASFWYTAWVNDGQPDLSHLINKEFSAGDLKEFESLNEVWKNSSIKGREHE